MIHRSYMSNGVGGQIHLAEAGPDLGSGPAVLLIHQTPRSWDEFREVMEILRADIHLIAMDLPGMGASDPLSKEASITTYAAAAARVAEFIDDENLVVCGHHTGAAVAVELAASRPDLVASLVLSSAPWVDADARVRRAKKDPLDTISRTREGDHLLSLWQQRSPYYPEKIEFMDRFITDALHAQDPSVGHHAVSRYQMEVAAPKVSCPVLLVEHKQDSFASTHSSDLREAFPAAKFSSISDGQVALEVTAPQFAEILGQWVYRHSASDFEPTQKQADINR